ncbi:MAG: hypothetical protein ABR521_03420 [Gaiellaceae bacterium]
MSGQMDRTRFLQKAGLGGAAAAFPALLGAEAAFAQAADSQIALVVAFSEAPRTSAGVQPRMAINAALTFRPQQRLVAGGGNWVLFDWARPATPQRMLASGRLTARQFVNWDTRGLSAVGTVQPGLLDLQADFEGLQSGVALRIICNVGPAGVQTGEPEGYRATTTQYGTFEPLSPSLGITHTSAPGYTTEVIRHQHHHHHHHHPRRRGR